VGGSPASSKKVFFISYSSSSWGTTTSNPARQEEKQRMSGGWVDLLRQSPVACVLVVCTSCTINERGRSLERRLLEVTKLVNNHWRGLESLFSKCSIISPTPNAAGAFGGHTISFHVDRVKSSDIKILYCDAVTLKYGNSVLSVGPLKEELSSCLYLVERDGHVHRVVRVSIQREAVQKEEVRVPLGPVGYVHLT